MCPTYSAIRQTERVTDAGVDWSERAATAERAVVRRHLRPVAGVLVGTAVAGERWPRPLLAWPRPWHPWWQAQFMECLVDAQLRSPTTGRARAVAALVRGIRVRNHGAWVTRRLGDTAWLGLAVQRAGALAGRGRMRAERAATEVFYRGWSEEGGGGLWWRRGPNAGGGLKSSHVNGPAAVMMARADQIDFAGSILDWVAETLLDPESGLVRAGVLIGADGSVREVDAAVHAGCQGSFLAACVELAHRDDHQRWGDRAVAAVDAVQRKLARGDGSLPGAGGGDGGLQGGVLARYLADAAMRRPELEAAAGRLVLASAEGAWNGRVDLPGGPTFSADWTMPALGPRRGRPEADLSVQLGAWMLLEAAARLQRAACLPD